MPDPFFQSILDALGQQLDGNQFEECVVDLLQPEFPSLVPVPGGNDAGMDGAIADGKGVPFPLVTTTGTDLLRNLRKNLLSHKAKHPRRRAVFATSRQVTTSMRRALHEEAERLGFVLVQVYGRLAVAKRLYRHPAWCLSLLGLTGDPPALSALPVSSRPLLNSRVIGRGKDLRWLRTRTGDRVLVGQPGVGKSFVLSRLAMSDNALFVIDEDRRSIANAVREQHPSALIIDDAHARIPLLRLVAHLRRDIHAEFAIVASCWPGSAGEVRETLGIAKSAVRDLELLTRDQIVRVIKDAGIEGPNELVREIVDQARGRAGLAVSLTHSCLIDGVERVASADALRESMVRTLARLVGPDSRQVLAAFAIGGRHGMTIKDVAGFLHMNKAMLHELLSGLAQGGVVTELGPAHGEGGAPSRDQRYAVAPVALQHALVRDVFFGTPSMPLRPIVDHADRACAAEVLVCAKLRGATTLSSEFLRSWFPPRISSEEPPSTWVRAATYYALLGSDEASWVLENFPGVLDREPGVLLERAPQQAIPVFLARAVGDTRTLHATPAHPMRILREWVEGHKGSVRDSIRRRRALLQAVQAWIASGRDESVGTHALSIAISPQVHGTEADPGSGNKLTWSMGWVSAGEADRILKLWVGFAPALDQVSISDWRHLIAMAGSWAAPEWPFPTRGDLDKSRRAVARRILRDLARRAEGRPGPLLEIQRLAKRIGHPEQAETDSELAFVVAASNEFEVENTKLLEIATAWATSTPRHMATRAAAIRREAETIGCRPFALVRLCEAVSRLVDRRIPWAEEFFDAGLPDDCIAQFLASAATRGEEGWAQVVSRLMDVSSTRSLCTQLALLQHAPSELFEKALAHEDELGRSLRSTRIPISTERMVRLLSHPSDEVAGAAALHEWETEPRASIRPDLARPWTEAILRIGVEDWGLLDVFKARNELALRWLLERSRVGDIGWLDTHSLVVRVIAVLEPSQRLAAIKDASVMEGCDELVAQLVSQDPQLYAALLATCATADVKLAPLRHPENSKPVPADMVMLALRDGHPPRTVVDAVYGNRWSHFGPASDHWKRWIDAFAPLTSAEDPKLRQVGRLGRRRARVERRRALAEEKEEAVLGRLA
jgi:hypothetical protein